MNKHEEDKLTNAIIALHQTIEKQGEETNRQLIKINPSIKELRLSVEQLDSRMFSMENSFDGLRTDFNKYAQRNDERVNIHETRIVRLEEKTSGGSYIAREPAVEYKRKKKK